MEICIIKVSKTWREFELEFRQFVCEFVFFSPLVFLEILLAASQFMLIYIIDPKIPFFFQRYCISTHTVMKTSNTVMRRWSHKKIFEMENHQNITMIVVKNHKISKSIFSKILKAGYNTLRIAYYGKLSRLAIKVQYLCNRNRAQDSLQYEFSEFQAAAHLHLKTILCLIPKRVPNFNP